MGSKYINGMKGNQVNPAWKPKAQRLAEAKAKLADLLATPGADPMRVSILERYIETLKARKR